MATGGDRERVNPHLLSFGKTVRRLREERRLTQEQLAHAADLHRTVVGFIERGEREVGISKLWPLADALGINVALLFESDPESANDDRH